jgi:hypothetical protein
MGNWPSLTAASGHAGTVLTIIRPLFAPLKYQGPKRVVKYLFRILWQDRYGKMAADSAVSDISGQLV